MKQDTVSVLVVDDKPDICLSLNYLLSDHGFEVVETTSPKQAIEVLNQRSEENMISVVLLDMNYSKDITSGEEGLALIQQIKSFSDKIEIIAMTAWSDIDLAVKAVRHGASDFISKPWEVTRLLQIVNQSVEIAQLKSEQRRLHALTQIPSQNIVCQSKVMQTLLQQLAQVAKTDVNVLLLGENGTGKSAIAQWVHHNSHIAEQSFVSVNMAAIPDNLFESELFGHKKGAFTDAKSDRIGRFEMAHNGTIFLDEIGTLSNGQQAKLLRVLEEKRFERLGDSVAIKSNARVITATNADLNKMRAEGEFRSDLYYRINTYQLEIPPLRERKEDILPLANYFIHKFGAKYNRKNIKLSEVSEHILYGYGFPGNIRELSHMIERAVILVPRSTQPQRGVTEDCEEFMDEIAPEHLNLAHEYVSSVTNVNQMELPIMPLEEAEKQLINKALNATGQNVQLAAELLGISKSGLYRRLDKYQIALKK